MKFYPHQIELSDKGAEILRKNRICYFAFEMRVGKTLTALRTAKLVSAKNVLFVTKKKAISSILSDFEMTGYKDMALDVINYEQLGKCEKRYD